MIAEGPVVIVGGGVVGTSLAFHLALHGHDDVTVLESGLVGEGSTAKATGGIRQVFSSEINADIVHEAVGYFEHFEERVGEPFAFRQHGYLFLLPTAEARAGFEKAVAMQRSLGIDSRIVEPEDLRDIVPGLTVDDLHGGVHCPSDGSGSPTDVAAAFARQARRRGVRIEQHTEVTGVTRGADGAVTGVVARTGTTQRTHPAATVVNAAGPWARKVGRFVGLELPVSPHPRQAFGIGPLPGLTADLPLTVDLASGAYVHPETAGGIVGGNDRDTPESEQATVRWPFIEGVLSALAHRIPWMADAEVRSGWCGLREMTPDDHAIVGPCDVPGWWNVVGFSGHGFMQSPVIGDHVARWMLGVPGARDLSALRLERFSEGGLTVDATAF